MHLFWKKNRKKGKMGLFDVVRFDYQLEIYSIYGWKKIQLSGSNNFNYYWHDLRQNADKIEKEPRLREVLMVWSANYFKGPSN